jgi:hypothetical protein
MIGKIATGSRSIVAFADEATYGVIPAANTVAYAGLIFVSEGLAENINNIQSEGIRSDRTVPAIRGGNLGTAGTVTTELVPYNHLKLLEHLMGKVSGAGTPVTPDAYSAKAYVYGEYCVVSSHIYVCVIGGTAVGASMTEVSHGAKTTMGDATFQNLGAGTHYHVTEIEPDNDFIATGLSLEKTLLGHDETSPAQHLSIVYAGCRVNSLGINIPQEGIVRAEYNFIGLKSQAYATYISTVPHVYAAGEDPFAGQDCGILMTGSTVPRPVREATLNITNNFDESVYALGNRLRRAVPEGRREISGTLTMYFEDRLEYDAFKGESDVALTFIFVGAAKVLKITLAHVKLTGSGTPTIQGSGVMTATYNFNAFNTSGTIAEPNDIAIAIHTPAS